MNIKIFNTDFLLLPERAVYWPLHSALILSDLHIGKSMHFRKEGLAIPAGATQEDLRVLGATIKQFAVEQLIIVGDMFHSKHNAEVELFADWRNRFGDVEIILAEGNHDIFNEADYDRLGIDVRHEIAIDAFLFSHICRAEKGMFCFSGHIHPGVRISGLARQSVKLPCFHFTPYSCTLPAFSTFTGLHIIKPKPLDKVYAISGKEVILF